VDSCGCLVPESVIPQRVTWKFMTPYDASCGDHGLIMNVLLRRPLSLCMNQLRKRLTTIFHATVETDLGFQSTGRFQD
jgi:hypothetical protein